MNWKELTSTEQLDTLIDNSNQRPVMIFKHSTRCSISSMALNRMERSWNDEETSSFDTYYLDLIEHRDISNAIAQATGVMHQSPQVVVIANGKAIYDNSHMGISYNEILNVIKGMATA